MSTPPPPHHRVVLGCFTLLHELGRGAHATAWLARQDGTDRLAVVKIAHASLIPTGDADHVAERFATEFRAASAVQHPNVATVYLTGTLAGGIPAIAMEFVEGPTLQRLLGSAPFDQLTVLALGAQLASALAAIHAAGIIHRDLSPANVIARPQGAAGVPLFKILDFGVSRFENLASNGLMPVGTPRYMAPEQFNLHPVPASDVYSLGCLLWWAATGQEHLAHLRTFADVLRHFHRNAMTRPDPEPLCALLDEAVAALIADALDPRPEARPSALTLAHAFEQHAALP